MARFLLLWTAFASAGFLHSEATLAGAPDPLFQSDDLLEVRIVAPIETLLSERPFEDELAGTLQFTPAAGETAVLDVQLRTRGRFRRRKDVCRFPPLRINFKTSQTKNTLFHKQDKVKLVTHCRASSRYERSVLHEYITYRILNLLSDISFKVRLLRITYVDSANGSELTRFGILIEHRNRLARRLEKSVVDIPNTTVNNLDPGYTNLVSIFHYLIGNTDYSPIAGAPDEPCCHNHELIGNDGERYWSVPYDFDQAGLVNATYAAPSERLKIRSVKQRLYRGRCANNVRIAGTVELFRQKKGDIYALIDTTPNIDKSSRKYMAAYIDKFYKTLDSDAKIETALTKACI